MLLLPACLPTVLPAAAAAAAWTGNAVAALLNRSEATARLVTDLCIRSTVSTAKGSSHTGESLSPSAASPL